MRDDERYTNPISLSIPHGLLMILLVALTSVSCSYKGAELWRRGTCEAIVDDQERETCLDDATRSENEYKQDIRSATE